jgi:recombination protein RecA
MKSIITSKQICYFLRRNKVMLMTGEQYIESLRKLNTRVYMFGEKIDNWVDHPIIRPSINCVAMTYDLALDPEYARNLGVDVDNLLISQPDTGEQALDITEELVRSGAVDIVVVDSVAALVPKAEIEGSMEDQQMGLQARLMSKALRKLTGIIGKTNTTVIFINQLRMKIGVMYGNPETTTGGNALKYYASVRMEIRRTEGLKGEDGDIGNHVRVRVLKNKVAPPFRTAEFDIVFGKGISKIGNILDVAVNLDIINKAGAWFSYKEEKLGQGREKAKEYLEQNPDVLAEVEKLVREKLAQG